MHFPMQVNKCLTDMVEDCAVEPICKPLPALPVVETCEEVPGGFTLYIRYDTTITNLSFCQNSHPCLKSYLGEEICEDVWTTKETTK